MLTLNRPDQLNALSYALVGRLMDLLNAIEEDEALHAVILTGAGRAFSAGADIGTFGGRKQTSDICQAGDQHRHPADIRRHPTAAASCGAKTCPGVSFDGRHVLAAASL